MIRTISNFLPGAPQQPSGPNEDELAYRQKIANALLEQSLKPQTIQSPTQGFAQMAMALAARINESRAKAENQGLRDEAGGLAAQFYGGGAGSGSVAGPAAGGGATPPAPPPQPPASSGPIPDGVKSLYGGGAPVQQPNFSGPGTENVTARMNPTPAPLPLNTNFALGGPDAPPPEPPPPSQAMAQALLNGQAPGQSGPMPDSVKGLYGLGQAPQVPGASGPVASTMQPPAPPQAGPLPQPYLDAIKKSEGYSERPTWDYKQWTSGYGTRASGPNDIVGKDELDQRFNTEVGKAAGMVGAFAPNAPEGVKAALTSLTYNAGPGWMKSGLGQAVQRGDWQTAQQLFQQYNKAGGQTLPGLQGRRAQEAQWFGGQPPAASGAPTPQGGGLIQLGQNGSFQPTPDMIKRMWANPYARPFAEKLLQDRIAQSQPDKQLDMDYKRAQIDALKLKGDGAAQVQQRYQLGIASGLKGDDLTHYSMTGKLPQQLQNGQGNQQAAANIAGGLNDLAAIPNKYDSFDNAVGPFRGDQTATWGNFGITPLTRAWGSITAIGNKTSPNEVRNDIQASSNALAATLKPLVRKPGEGAWSDKDQEFLDRIVGNLSQANDKAEYYRRLEEVRQRVRANFGIDLPPIKGMPGGAAPAGQGGALRPGGTYRYNPATGQLEE